MPTVLIAVSGMQRNIDIVWPLMGGIVAAFAPFGVTLVPQLGQVLDQDPYGAPGGWDDLIRDLHASSNNRSPAHLVATDTAPDRDPTIDGLLWDPNLRGGCAVFMRAQIYGAPGPAHSPALVTEVCVHELGHLLNLTHGDGALGGYANAMLPAFDRKSQSPTEAWRSATSDAASRGEPTIPTPNPCLTYPFNAQCRANLREATVDDSWLPYESAFRGDGQGATSVDDRSLDLTILPHEGERPHVGGGLYFTVRFENRGDAPVELPLHVSPEHGALRIIVDHEDGRRAVYKPAQVHCSGARQTLAPGQVRFESVAVVGRQSTDLIASPGLHRCRVELLDDHGPRRAMLGASEFEFVAEDDAAKAEVSRRLARLVTPGAVRPSGGLRLDGIDERCAAASHLRLAAALRRRPGTAQRAELEASLDPHIPRALRHAAARRLALQQLERGRDPIRLEDELAAQFSDAADQPLIFAFRRSAEGWMRHTLRGSVR